MDQDLAGDGIELVEDPARTATVAAELREYFAGRRFDLDPAPRGTDFQQAVWRELLRIPYGETRS